MRLFKLALTIALATFIIDGVAAQAQTTYYSRTSGYWTSDQTWSTESCGGAAVGGNHYPGASDTAIVCDGDIAILDASITCTSTTIQQNAEIDDGGSTYVLTISGSGGLDIDSGGLLDIRGSGGVTLTGGGTHPIDGTIELDASGSDVTVTTSNATVSGSGEIKGQNDAAVISIADSITLTNSLTTTGITGHLEIAGAGIFLNQGKVYANADSGTLEISVASVTDSANGNPVSETEFRWGVNNSGAVLLFTERDATGLLGDFFVREGTAQFGEDPEGDDDIDVCSTGDILFDGGSIGTGVADSFKCSGSCP